MLLHFELTTTKDPGNRERQALFLFSAIERSAGGLNPLPFPWRETKGVGVDSYSFSGLEYLQTYFLILLQLLFQGLQVIEFDIPPEVLDKAYF